MTTTIKSPYKERKSKIKERKLLEINLLPFSPLDFTKKRQILCHNNNNNSLYRIVCERWNLSSIVTQLKEILPQYI